PLSVSQLAIDERPSETRSVNVSRMNSGVSSVPTLITKESSLRPSQNSQPTESDLEEEEEVEEEDSVRSDYYLTAKSKLELLFRRCQDCGALIDPISLEWTQVASALSVTYQCTGCKHLFRWDTQSKKGRGKSQVFDLNQSFPVAAFCTGTPIPRLVDLCDVLSIAIARERSMRETIRFYGCPAIDRVYGRWEKEARQLSKDTAPEEGIIVALDGQYDSPGYCASNCKVTVFDSSLGLILVAVSLSVKDPEMEGISSRMESYGSERALEELIDDGFNISTRVSDSNAMVDKRIRENPKLGHIVSLRDFWHVQKPLRKEWWIVSKGMKSFPLLAVWYKSFFNHLYYTNTRYPKREDRKLALELVQSFIHHCTGKHKWVKDGDFSLVTKCNHPITRTKKGKTVEKRVPKEKIKVLFRK
ncbi:hypothetical protein PENTCL1PPCAC_20291, partial [Pristionchus entomophagus]